MNVLSLFDGMSCGQIALRELGMQVDGYYASEIDVHAIKQTQLNFPNTIQLGDVTEVRAADLPRIDLLIGGSPCQGFSIAGKQLNFNDPRSALFFEFVRILNEVREINPEVKFLLENVRMKKEYDNAISEQLGLHPVMINSSLVSAQNRVRLYWTNIRTRREGLFGDVYTDIPQPNDRGLLLKDILEPEVDRKYYLSERMQNWLINHANKRGVNVNKLTGDDKSHCWTVASGRWSLASDYVISGTLRTHRCDYGFREIKSGKGATLLARARQDGSSQGICKITRAMIQLNPERRSGGVQPYQQDRVYDDSSIAPCHMANMSSGSYAVKTESIVRRITPTECARLQTIPDWYRWECSDTQQYKMLGNGWTVEVIKHIFKHINH